MDSTKTFSLTSTDLGGQGTRRQEADTLGGNGDNVSPQLSWSNAPAGTKSFAITMHDADAPTPGGFWHWVVFDLPIEVSSLPTGAGSTAAEGMPSGAKQSVTDFGVSGYGGPAPPAGHGLHRYIITVHALDCETLGPDTDTPAGQVGFNIWAHQLGMASIVFYYQR